MIVDDKPCDSVHPCIISSNNLIGNVGEDSTLWVWILSSYNLQAGILVGQIADVEKVDLGDCGDWKC